MEKRGIAGVIATVLILLLVLALFVLVWNVVGYMIKSKASDISIEGFLVDGELEYYLPNEFAIVKVKRGAGDSNITGVRIDFTESSGTNYFYNTTDYPAPLETKRYVIFINQLNPLPTLANPSWNFGFINSIALHYLLLQNKFSKELDKKDIKPNKISNKDFFCLYPDADGDGYGTGDACQNFTSAQSGKSPLNGDCDDNSPTVGVCGGTTPYCNSGVCANNKNYVFTSSSNIKDYWIYETGESGPSGKTICGTGAWSTITTFPTQVNWNFNFYKDPKTAVYVCKEGYLGFTTTCNTMSISNAALGLTALKSKSMIAPYLMDSGDATNSVKYCSSTDYIVFKWDDGSIKSEAVLYNNGEIRYSYSSSSSNYAEVGISYDSTYYTKIVDYGSSISKDYKLTF